MIALGIRLQQTFDELDKLEVDGGQVVKVSETVEDGLDLRDKSNVFVCRICKTNERELRQKKRIQTSTRLTGIARRGVVVRVVVGALLLLSVAILVVFVTLWVRRMLGVLVRVTGSMRLLVEVP